MISVTIKPITYDFCNGKVIANLFFHLCEIKEGASYFKYGINTINKVKKLHQHSHKVFSSFSQKSLYAKHYTD